MRLLAEGFGKVDEKLNFGYLFCYFIALITASHISIPYLSLEFFLFYQISRIDTSPPSKLARTSVTRLGSIECLMEK